MIWNSNNFPDKTAKRPLHCDSVNEVGIERMHSPTDETAFQANLAMSHANLSFSLNFSNNSFMHWSRSRDSSTLNAVLTLLLAA